MATLDDKVRDSHQRMHGQVVDAGDTFPNGLLHPGDPNGRASEVVNCRCHVVAVIETGKAKPVGVKQPAPVPAVQIPAPRSRGPVRSLTERQIAIGRLVAAGWSNKEIAHELGIGEQAVKNLMHNAFRRLGIGERVSLALYILREGLLANA